MTIPDSSTKRSSLAGPTKSKLESHQQISGPTSKPTKIQTSSMSASQLETEYYNERQNIVDTADESAEEDTVVVKVHQLVDQSSRWLNQSSCLWCLIIMDTHRDVDKDSLSNFIQMLEWRINGSISEEEFAALYSEWGSVVSTTAVQSASTSTTKSIASSVVNTSGSKAVSLFGLRNIFMALGSAEESRLDLYIALVSYETNRVLLNNPICYKSSAVADASSDKGRNHAPKSSLETCSRQWLELVEELFFLLDAHGGGQLKFDDVYFLCACCVIGLGVWTVTDGQLAEDEVEQDISPVAVTALTLQFMKDAGCKVNLGIFDRASLNTGESGNETGSSGGDGAEVTPTSAPLSRRESSSGNASGISAAGAATSGAATKRRTSISGAFAWTNSSAIPYSTASMAGTLTNVTANRTNSHMTLLSQNLNNARSMMVTLPMFKKLLLKRGIGEMLLRALVSHVKSTVAHLYSIALANEAEDLTRSMQFETTTGTVVGSPKLWCRAVALATGADEPISTGALHEPDPVESEDAPDPLRLFLLSDADRQLGGVFYATNADPDCLTINSTGNGHDSGSDKNSGDSVHLHERLLYPMGNKLLCAYKMWSGLMFLTKETGTNIGNTCSFPHHIDAKQLESLQKEPVFMLLFSTLVEYKTLQNQFTAALFDLVVTTYAEAQQAATATLVSPGHSHISSPKSAAHGYSQDGMLSRVCAMLLHPAVDVQKELEALVTEVYATQTKKHHEDYSFAAALFNSQHGHHHAGASNGGVPMSAQLVSPSTSTNANVNVNASLKREMSHGNYGSFHGQGSVGVGHSTETGSPSPVSHAIRHSGVVTFENLKIADTSNAQWKAVFDDVTPAESPAPAPAPVTVTAPVAAEHNSDNRKNIKTVSVAESNSNPLSMPASTSVPATPSVLSSDSALETMLIDRLLNATDDAERERILSALRVLRVGSEQPSAAVESTPHFRSESLPPSQQSKFQAQRKREVFSSTSASDKFMQNHSESSGFSKTPGRSRGQNSPLSRQAQDQQKRGLEQEQAGKLTIQNMQDSPGMSSQSTGSPLTLGSGGVDDDDASTSATSIAELMAQGQSAGVYAQSLREILRKMSRNDTKVQIKVHMFAILITYCVVNCHICLSEHLSA